MGRRRNMILKLKSGHRALHEPDLIKKEIVNFFKRLYQQEELPNVLIPDGFLSKLEIVVMVHLEFIPAIEEIKEAVWSCESSKAPRYDGYNLNFIKILWHVIGMIFQSSFWISLRLICFCMRRTCLVLHLLGRVWCLHALSLGMVCFSSKTQYQR